MKYLVFSVIMVLANHSFGQSKTFFDFTTTDIDGKEVKLSQFKGKKILVVNVASECSNTPQYEELQQLYDKYGPDKFVIIGFPANNFGGQEPGTNLEIKEFCKKNYGVSFPMAAKVSVKGDDMAPIYKWLVEQSRELAKAEQGTTSKDLVWKRYLQNPVDWNFTKFLIDENGKLVAVFHNKVSPMSEEITKYLN